MNDLLGTIPQWLTALGIGSFFVALLRRDVQVRGLRNADTADIRDHYADELKALRDRLDIADKRYLEAMKLADSRWEESNRRHEECVKEREDLRDELTGLKRQIIRYSSGKLTILEEAPESRKAAERVRKITNEPG
jgi:hypothetical protein